LCQTNGSSFWENEITGLINGAKVYFVQTASENTIPAQGGTIMSEVACEGPTPQTCDIDQPSFKAYLSRWLAVTTQLASFTTTSIMPLLKASAQAAAQNQCTGQSATGQPGTVCGRRWYQAQWDNNYGVGEQMSAMSVIQNLLIGSVNAPYSGVAVGGQGTSKGNPDAGTGNTDNIGEDPLLTMPITTADKAGAGILTAISLALLIGGASWMVL
jgi:mannan endo-1,6-alpha-mannosidase